MLLFDNILWILLAALVMDALIGDPDWLWRRFRHPAVLFGAAITSFDRRWNRPAARGVEGQRAGLTAILLLIAVATVVGVALEWVLRLLPFGGVVIAALAAILIAQRSLYLHVKDVADTLELQGLPEARRSVARIVGRNPDRLSEAGVVRASIESLAENFSDGVVAPAFWFALFGLPGLLVYKMVNTADSMIGHRTTQYLDFGRAAARIDDALNYIPARLSAVLVAIGAILVHGRAGRAIKVVRADARHHRSPNAGWPEAAFAGALDIALSGPRVYDTGSTNDAFVNPAGKTGLTALDIRESLRLFWAACGIQAVLVGLMALL